MSTPCPTTVDVLDPSTWRGILAAQEQGRARHEQAEPLEPGYYQRLGVNPRSRRAAA